METRNSTQPNQILVDGGLDEKSKNCEICNEEFANNRGLKQHIGKIHSNSEKKFRCDKCRKKFRTKHSLKAHQMNVHEKATQIVCIECNKVFSSKYICIKHQKKKHPIIPRID